MHNNYYFLRQLSSSLHSRLAGTVISECYSQNKDELIFRFETHGEPFFVKVSMAPGFSHLSFPPTVQRARKNSIDLFSGAIGYRILGIRQFENERTFALELEQQRLVLFRLHGNRANIILTEDLFVTAIFRSNIAVEDVVHPEKLDRTIDWSLETFLSRKESPVKLYFTFGALLWRYLKIHGFDQKDPHDQWKQIQDLRTQLENPSLFISEIDGKPHLTLVPLQQSRKITSDPVEASNIFFQEFTQRFGLESLKARVASTLRARIKSSETYIEKNLAKLAEIRNEYNYKIWADMIMANLHQLNQGLEKVNLSDFYNEGHMIEVRLRKDLTPQANAALYYRKAKNQHLETERLENAVSAKQKEIEKLKFQLEEAEQITNIRAFRDRFDDVTSEKEKPVLPYYEFQLSGFRIWVGKGARQNDELTLRHAYKEDLWLHAKDVAGSHVVVKHQSGKKIPQEVIERAAQLAAYNSKRRTESLCPVIVTPRKFVRKRKGDPPGAVVVEKENVIMVQPKL